jgi:hypothetical protein
VDSTNRHITHLVVRDGHPWNWKEVMIPVRQVTRIAEKTMYLKLDRRQSPLAGNADSSASVVVR